MPGGLMQLVAYGAQDLYLTGNPQMTYYKLVYKRYTKFATEYIRLDFETIPQLSTTLETQGKVKILRHADLVNDCYLVIDIPPIYGEYISGFKWVNYLGFALIKYVTLTIGGAQVDKQYGQWLIIWNELTLSDEKKKYLYEMINVNQEPLYDSNADWENGVTELNDTTKKILLYRKKRLYIPLLFWFCTNPGLSLPLISLQYSDVYVNFYFNPLNRLFTLSSYNLSPDAYVSTETTNRLIGINSLDEIDFRNKLIGIGGAGYTSSDILFYFINRIGNFNMDGWDPNLNLEANFIYLDNDEREMFSKYAQEYLISQVQQRDYKGLTSGPNTIEIKLNHPVKEVVWIFQRSNAILTFNAHSNFTYLSSAERYESIQKFLKNFKAGAGTNFVDFTSSLQFYNRFVNQTVTQTLADPYNITDNNLNIFQQGRFIFNGKDRFREKDFMFFNSIEPFKHHTGHPNIPGINTYSFSLKPEEEQPSGSCNFSRINKFEFTFTLKQNFITSDNSQLVGSAPNNNIPSFYGLYPGANVANIGVGVENGNVANLEITNTELYDMEFYAVNYNVLRIMAGMGDVTFAN